MNKVIYRVKSLILQFKKPLFLKTLISYSLLFSIPLTVIGILNYNNLLNSIVTQNKTQYSNIMKESVKELDNKMKDIINTVVQFSQVGEISKIIKTGNLGVKKLKNNITTINNCKNQLGVAAANNDLVQHIVIQFIEDDLYFSTWGGCSQEDFFKDVLFFLDKSRENMIMNVEEESYFVPVSKVNFMGIITNLVIYSKKMPTFQNNSNSRCLFLINRDSLESILHKGTIMEFGINMLVDSHGNCIFSSSNGLNDEKKLELIHGILEGRILNENEIIINNEKYILFSQKSKFYDLQYISIIPRFTIMYNTKPIMIQTIMILTIILLFGLIISFILAKMNSEPVYDIMNIFFDSKTLESLNMSSSDEYHFLKQNIKMIVSNNLYLKTEIQKVRPILMNYVLRKIITGNILSIDNLQNDMDTVGLFFPYDFFICVMFLKYEKLPMNEIIKNQLKSKFLGNDMAVFFIDIDLLKTVMVVNLKDTKGNDIKKEVIQCIEENHINLMNNNVQAIAIGRVVSNLQNIYLSFQDCQEIIENTIDFQKCPILIYSKEDKQNKIFYYIPEYTGREILELLMQGEDRKAYELCEKAVNDSINPDNINVFVIQHMMYSFLCLAHRALKNMNVEYNIGYKFSDFKEINSINKMLVSIENVFSEVCKHIRMHHESKRLELWNRIVNFIQENFTNTQLTLSEVARSLNVTPQYLCRYMKNHSGYTFLEYINKIRVEYSKQLLLRGESIKDAAEKSGFSNDLTFRRQFKKNENMTPGQYKKMLNSDYGIIN
ncbi:MAG: helix-turn-helix transcriptional regulator [Firmicutes bacterium]|nr:helix-turn-helix transcriptional regulator [Bacillota bacterium]